MEDPSMHAETGLMQSKVIYETHSTQPCATARASLPTYRNQVQFCTSFNYSCFKCDKPTNAMHAHKYVHDLPSAVPQPQLLLEMCHSSQDGGEKAVQVQDQHCAGDQERQCHRHHVDARDNEQCRSDTAPAMIPVLYGVNEQCVGETFIAPVLMFNHIAVFK